MKPTSPSPTLERRLTRGLERPKRWWAPYDDDSAYRSIAHHPSHGEWMCFGSPYLRYTAAPARAPRAA